jgi:hypothetical protein
MARGARCHRARAERALGGARSRPSGAMAGDDREEHGLAERDRALREGSQ